VRDIAREAQVAQSTVSRILNGTDGAVPITLKTRQRVTEAALRLGYRPNPMARALRGAPTMLMGAVVRDITDPFFSGAIEALTGEARRRGYNIVLGSAHGEATQVLELAAVLEARQCDAVLLLGDISDRPQLTADLDKTHIPVVGLWQGRESPIQPSVNVDNRFGIRLGLEHLASLGHTRIAFVAGREIGAIGERLDAYREWMAERDLRVPDGYVHHGPNMPESGEEAFAALLGLSYPPTAIVTSTDTLALGVLHAIGERGVHVPGDVSVVGFDDISLAAHFVPALTTVRMPVDEIITAAVDIAIAARTGGKTGQPTIAFRPTLVTRASTGPVPASGEARS
jgi:DNA-binding LacI/PurR family transcriptional regulator